MNIKNAKTLVGQLKRLPDEKFDMGPLIAHRSCGTVACIAGYASILNGGPTEDDDVSSPYNFAQKWLGLNTNVAESLFHGWWANKRYRGDITRLEAIAELERMIEAES